MLPSLLPNSKGQTRPSQIAGSSTNVPLYSENSMDPPQSGTYDGVVPTTNIDSLLQVHRRKMLRRAANRRSAQLSRARKKAHLEDLKVENARLQRQVDMLDSQPELVFCIASDGRITYVSERTINFIKINFPVEDFDEDPSHISQILSKDSVSKVLEAVAEIAQHSSAVTSIEALESDAATIFASKEVFFHDAFGCPLVGYLRCSKVIRRSLLLDLSVQDGEVGLTKEIAAVVLPAAKKQKVDNIKTSDHADDVNQGWNLANFKLLTDCATSFTRNDPLATTREVESHHQQPQKGKGRGQASNKADVTEVDSGDDDISVNGAYSNEEDEYVCVIRTSDSCFGKYRPSSSLLVFSSLLSTASMVAHDLEQKISKSAAKDGRPGSPHGSSHSGNSSGPMPLSDSSSKAAKNSTSSETGSEDVCASEG